MIRKDRDKLNMENNSAIALHAASTGHFIDLEHPKIKLANQAYYAQLWISGQLTIAATPTRAIAWIRFN